MNKNIKWIITAAVLALFIAVAGVLYNNLSEDYSGNNFGIQETENTSTAVNESENVSNDETESYPLYEAPDFTVFDENGNEVRLSDYRGKPVVLNFWATWCYYCKLEMPDFNTAYEKYPDVQFLMVNVTDGFRETVSIAKEYVESEGFDFDVFYDTQGNAVNTYGIRSYPYTLFIDKDGNLIANAGGMLDMETLERGIAMITAE